ncbi:MAG TPA: phospholipase D-like domain-containing protein [Candidatus Binatia bacterium]|nr:phospholipase D-like domain-containing protein [Candidatus Binatia bacterium]
MRPVGPEPRERSGHRAAGERPGHRARLPEARILADQTFARVAGAPLVAGNSVRILRDAGENYPAWEEAIGRATRTVHFESYIIHEDDAGRRFAALLADRARAGVRVRLIYDWLGGLGHASARFWRGLRDAGVEVRCFNPPRFGQPFGWLSRDHRKMIAVDGRIGFVTGLCVGQRWVGRPERGIEPWRDTGVEVRGPAVADIERAFEQTWALTGDPLPDGERVERDALPAAGDVMLRVIASVPHSAGLYRLDQLIAAGARRSLWLTDAYFVGVTPYVQALRAAALDGVDVRLLVPGASDVWLVRSLSRAGYRPLLEAGVRVFEWNGSMLHAKTAVADGRWARVGSTNLNIASWLGNWELDVAVEDDRFAEAMEAMFLDDLTRATEIVLGERTRVSPVGPAPRRRADGSRGSAGRAAAGAIGIGSAIGAAITNHRALGPAEARVMGGAGLGLLILAIVAVVCPWLIVIPLALVGGWVGLALLCRARALRREGRLNGAPAPGDAAAPATRAGDPGA